MKRNMSNMNNIMTRLFTVIMLMMFSVGIQAQVKVFYGENGDDSFKGGKVGVKGQTKPDEKNNVTVTLIVTPDKGYTITKKDIKVYAILSASARATRGLEISKDLTLDGDDPKDLSAERTYTVTLDANLGLWVKEATFTRKSDGAKATTIDFNLPDGYYYLGNQAGNNSVDPYDPDDFGANFYMCPAYSTNIDAKNYLGGDEAKPLITTFKSFSDNNKNQGKTYSWAVWYIEAVTGDGNEGYFYIKHRDSGKYLFANDNTDPAANRRRVNLGPTFSPGNDGDGMFKIQSDDSGNTYYISSRTKDNGDNKYLNPSKANLDNLSATSDNSNTGGILGFWKEKTTNSAWHFVPVRCDVPEISYNIINDEVTITGTEGTTIYYTTDGLTDPNPDEVGGSYPTQLYDPDNKPTISAKTTIKAIATLTGYANSEVATATIYYNLTVTLDPISSIYDGSSKSVTVSVADGLNPIENTKYEVSYKKEDVVVSELIDAGTYTVIVSDKEGDDEFVSGSADFTIEPAELYAVNLPEEPLTYSGEAQSVSITSVTAGDGTLVVPSDDYTVSGNEGTNVGDYTITVTAKENTNYTGSVSNTFTISPKSLGNGITPTEGITIDDITWTNDTYSNPGIYFKETPLVEGEEHDYTVTTSGNATSKYYIVTFTGANNFTGSVESKFVNVDFYHNDAATCWASSFVINSGEGAFAIPDGYSAHIVTGIDGTTVTAPSLTYVPEGVPVILLADTSSDADAKGFTAQPISGDAPDTSGNMLKFVTEDSEGYDSGNESMHFDTGEIYLLYNGEFVLNKEGDLAKGKVYLDPSAPGAGSTPAPARLAFLGNPYTDIENVSFIMKEQETDEKWYSLDGCRLNGRPTKKGLYLMNRKKVVIK